MRGSYGHSNLGDFLASDSDAISTIRHNYAVGVGYSIG